MGGSRLALIAATVALAVLPQTARAQRAAGLRPDSTSLEGGIWGSADKAEAAARTKADVNHDPALNAYVRGVTCKVAADHCPDLRVYVLDRPAFNALVAPNGYVEVWSGLMLRSTDEAEFAYVLGHEFSHFVQNHTLVAYNAAKSRANVALAAKVAIAVVGVAAASGATTTSEAQSIMDATGNLIDVVYLAEIAAFFRFSREQEAEADLLGQKRAAIAGYDARSAAQSWRSVMAETQASDFKRVRESRSRTSVFESHPLEAERIAVLDKQASSLPASSDRGRERYRAAIRPHLSAWLRDDLRRRDFGQTLHLIDRLAASGEDLGVLNYYRGEAYRLRRGDGDLGRARDAYLAAAAQPDTPLAAWRELGDIRKRDGDAAGARAAYETYLAKAPQAEDAWLVQDSLSSLDKGS